MSSLLLWRHLLLNECRCKMNEFRLHHLVSELISTFQLEGDSADSYVELLSRNMNPYVTTQVSLGRTRDGCAQA